MKDTRVAAAEAKAAAIKLAAIDGQGKNRALEAVAELLDAKREAVTAANRNDLERGERGNLAAPLLKRLKFDDAKIDGVIDGIRSLIDLPEPVGETLAATELEPGLELYRISCPIGVIGVIFESRPDALVQISTLCLKSGNAALLKGGREAAETNRILADIIAEAAATAGIPEGWIQLLETRDEVNAMLALDEFIDLIIPRGSNEFVQYIMNNSNIPVLGHADGICHVYIDRAADPAMAVEVAVDSKTQYVAVCNAAETILVHRAAAAEILPPLAAALRKKNVEIRGCRATAELIDCDPASEDDWKTEYLDYIVAVKVVDSMDGAIDHINQYGSGHTEAIITNDAAAAAKFMDLCDSGNVFWNCSTRFSDGFRYGLGAEVGISTNKIHARGPVGLDGLLIYKWKLVGHGQTVAQFADGGKKYTHRRMEKKFVL